MVQVALQRYSCAMATIQVREVPEEAYEVLRRRARRAGQSMQAYMRDQVIAFASRQTKEEAVAAIEATLQRAGITEAPDIESIVDDIAAGRR